MSNAHDRMLRTLEEPAGVWGGTTPTERAGLARQRRRSEITRREAS